jgi:hypothetical protein
MHASPFNKLPRTALKVSVLALAILIGSVVFWPTLWRYDKFGSGDSAIPMRTHRLTGSSELFFPGSGWVRQQEGETAVQLLPPDAIKQLTGNGGILAGSFDASIYNGSNWEIREIQYRISTKARTQRPTGNPLYDSLPDIRPGYWTRIFRHSLVIAPFSTGKDFFEVGFVANGADVAWEIVRAWGRPHNAR